MLRHMSEEHRTVHRLYSNLTLPTRKRHTFCKLLDPPIIVRCKKTLQRHNCQPEHTLALLLPTPGDLATSLGRGLPEVGVWHTTPPQIIEHLTLYCKFGIASCRARRTGGVARYLLPSGLATKASRARHGVSAVVAPFVAVCAQLPRRDPSAS